MKIYRLRLRLRLRSPGFTDDREFSVHLVDWLVVEELPAVSFVFLFEISVNYRVFRKNVSTREIAYNPNSFHLRSLVAPSLERQ